MRCFLRAVGPLALMIVLALAVVAVPGCGGGGGGGGEQHSDAAINSHVGALSYDPAALLHVQPITGSQQRTATGAPLDTDEAQGTDLLTCAAVDYDLQSNADQVAILRPTNGIIWPGALVKVNASLLQGLPEPLTLAPAPVTLRLDLPGIGDRGTFTVAKPSNSAVQSGLDSALAWWNDNAYQEGYVNGSASSYQASTSYSSEQLALDVGLNVEWASGSVASEFQYTSSSTGTVAMVVFKQVFYTVTADTPATPADVFAGSVLPSQLDAAMSDATPPGYVQSVSYGRIVMFRMETSDVEKSVDMQATLKYAAGASFDASLESHYKSILQKSSITVVTLGGNAEVASYAVTAQNAGDLAPILTGANAVYSKSNPGVAIAYTVRFLKDNALAKMGYTTSYTATECTRWHQSQLSVYNGGGYVARAYARYYPHGSAAQVTIGTGNFTAGVTRMLTVPAGATSVELWADDEYFIASWTQIGYVTWPVAPEAIKYCLKGTTLNSSWQTCN
jgi:thiol-activated cytolysin